MASKLDKFTGKATKGGGQALLPDRRAVDKLLNGNPYERSMGNYAKLTPSGRNGPMTYQSIIDMARKTTR